MVSKRKVTDIGWEHGKAIDGDKRKVMCNYCSKIVSGGITRLKQHVANIPGNVEPCPSSPKEVSNLIRQSLIECSTHRVVARKNKRMLVKSLCDEDESKYEHKISINVDSDDTGGGHNGDDLTSYERTVKIVTKESTETAVDEEEQHGKHSISDAETGTSSRSNLTRTRRPSRSDSVKEGGQSPAKLNSYIVQGKKSGQKTLKDMFDDKVKRVGRAIRPLSVNDSSATPRDGLKVRISFKGLPGAYSEDAVLKVYPQCETVPCHEFEDAFKAVELWMADKAILPIENSLGGSIHGNYDLLLSHKLHIVGEVQVAMNLCLLALPGVSTEQLKRVLSRPEALAQSDVFLTKLGIARENVDDEACSAQFVGSNGLEDVGVIASARAAQMYGLNILAERIHDDTANITRFLVLAKDPIIPRTDKPFKTSIVFTLEEGPGMLFKALSVFALRDINVTKIESRPQGKKPLRAVNDSNTGTAKYFDYLFYIDFEASMAESSAQCALGHLQEFATFLRILGCYPLDSVL